MQSHADTSPDTADVAGVIAPPPLIIAAGFLAGVVLDRALPQRSIGRRTTGLLLLATGLGLAGWGVKTMHEAKTPIQPTEPTQALVTAGPFHHTRNPLYLGMLLMYTSLALLIDHFGPLLTLPGVVAVLRRGVVEREERYLERKFGDEYRAYRSAVPRWLLR